MNDRTKISNTQLNNVTGHGPKITVNERVHSPLTRTCTVKANATFLTKPGGVYLKLGLEGAAFNRTQRIFGARRLFISAFFFSTGGLLN